MEWIHQVFTKSPEIALFLSLAVGYFIGQINFGKFQLGGVGGSLLAAVSARVEDTSRQGFTSVKVGVSLRTRKR